MLLVILSLSAWVLAGPPPFEVASRRFSWEADPRQYRIHLLLPHDLSVPLPESASSHLDRVADFVWADSEKRGYLNRNTEGHYRQEVENLRKGRWPVLFITAEGDLKVLAMLAFAIRWGDEALPVEQRFFQGNSFLPKGIPATETVHQNVFFPFLSWTIFPQLKNDLSLKGLLALAPGICGEKAEIKFLLKEEEAPSFLVTVLLSAARDADLPFYSAKSPSLEARQKVLPLQRRDFERIQSFKLDPSPGLSHPYRDAIERYFIQWALDPFAQRTIFHSALYVHASGKGRPMGSRRTATRTYFVRNLNVPALGPWAFQESISVGTPGISTEIFEFSPAYYGTHILKKASQELHYHDPPCSAFLSRIERDLIENLAGQGLDIPQPK